MNGGMTTTVTPGSPMGGDKTQQMAQQAKNQQQISQQSQVQQQSQQQAVLMQQQAIQQHMQQLQFQQGQPQHIQPKPMMSKSHFMFKQILISYVRGVHNIHFLKHIFNDFNLHPKILL